ncbi:methylated-DNA--protein-cysteine methyltransferase isoform X2 [Heteronotia binoei]|uniref:methylated-DNA--protein-cysteine methyltransferase isoform X2 n=1 Tax=Heteronotia binoei TaxID=13085 RepID=UPI00293176C8|nr:methylated-DNA--protein-cysteine methyltransferase isoform X2 [Heteronotia binoei]
MYLHCILKMASRLHQKIAFKDGKTQCEKVCVVLSSPVGRIEVYGCSTGVHEIQMQGNVLPSSGTVESLVSCEVCEAPEEMTEPLKQCVAWLQAYFCEPWMTEKLTTPPFHHPLLEKASFTREVLRTLLRDVKFGEAVSYKQLAALAGNSKAARAVGGAMRSNPVPIIIPCHRVICSSGQTGNYTGGSHLKEWLLSHERLQKEKLAY